MRSATSSVSFGTDGFGLGVTGVLVPFDLDFSVDFSADDFDFFICALELIQ